MKNNLKITTLLLVSLVSLINAQEIIQISKAEVLERVSQENQTLKISKEDFNEARADYRQILNFSRM